MDLAKTLSDSPTNVNILITSDVHLNVDKIHKIGNWMVEHRRSVDFIICCGDMCNFDPSNSEKPELVSSCEGEMSVIISALENICPRVLYIPGNHDAKTTMVLDHKRPRLTTHSINIHNRSIRICPDLVLLGLGGSVPAYQGNESVWEGFPYRTEQEINAHLSTLVKSGVPRPASSSNKQEGIKPTGSFQQHTRNDEIYDDDKVVLVTHVGPYDSSTTLDQVVYDALPIQSGSKSLKDLLLEPLNQSRILLNIHGHTHHSLGLSRVGKTFILNPGATRTGHFCLLTLNKPFNTKWQISGAEFHRT